MRKKNRKHIKKSKSFTKRTKALKNIKAQRQTRLKKIAASERIDISGQSRLAKYFDKLTPSHHNTFRLKKDRLKVKIPNESPRVHRRPVCLSQATLPDSFKLS